MASGMSRSSSRRDGGNIPEHTTHCVALLGLMSCGPNMYRRSAVARILRGAKPGELPVEQPIKFELAVNAKTAVSLGITVPHHCLLTWHPIHLPAFASAW